MDDLEFEHFSTVYDKLRKLARRTLLASGIHLTLDPTDLVHEAWVKLRAGKNSQRWFSEMHFYAAAAETMRHLLVDRTRRKSALKHGGGFTRKPIEFAQREFSLPVSDEICFLRLHVALQMLQQESSSGARVIDLKYFAGLSNEEVAVILELNEAAVRRLWTWARVRLFQLYTQIERQEFSGDEYLKSPALN
jgi:RNA polymerase sigma factor (TIGR02999 family)